jgi:GGDEF domain-containing protein
MEYRRSQRRQFRRHAISFKLVSLKPIRLIGGQALISIRKSVSDLDREDELSRREALSRTILDCFSSAIQSSAQYAVEVNHSITTEFRNHLQAIEEQSRKAATEDQLRSVQASFRGELREYRDKTGEQLKKLRKELENATSAMMTMANSVASSGTDHEREVCAELGNLRSVAKSENIQVIRSGIKNAAEGIESSVERIQQANQLIISQLQDEIRALHQEIESERKALYTDRSSGAWNRQKFDLHTENLLRQNRPFCLLLVCVRNLKRLESQHSRTVVEGTLKALVERFAAMIDVDAAIGRWSQDQFAAIVDLPPSLAMHLSSEAASKLSGPYAIQENGMSQKVTVQATAGLIERPSGHDPADFQRKLEQLAVAVSGA